MIIGSVDKTAETQGELYRKSLENMIYLTKVTERQIEVYIGQDELSKAAAPQLRMKQSNRLAIK